MDDYPVAEDMPLAVLRILHKVQDAELTRLLRLATVAGGTG